MSSASAWLSRAGTRAALAGDVSVGPRKPPAIGAIASGSFPGTPVASLTPEVVATCSGGSGGGSGPPTPGSAASSVAAIAATAITTTSTEVSANSTSAPAVRSTSRGKSPSSELTMSAA